MKQCRSAAEREDYLVILGAIAPERETAATAASHREDCHSAAKVFKRLNVQGGWRYKKGGGKLRPRAPEAAIDNRARFDHQTKTAEGRHIAAGDKASSRGRECTVVEIDYDADTCKLAFEFDGVKLVRPYSCIYKGSGAPGKGPFPKGSARLRSLAPSLRPSSRARRSDEKVEIARPKVEEIFNAEGAR